MKRILVTGGLGYIGSHTVLELLATGHDVTIIDNLSNSNIRVLDRIEKISGVRPDFFEGDIRDEVFLENIFSGAKIDGVIHFAALKSVAESFEMRDEYFSVNVGGTENLIRIMERHGIRRLVFSSSAATYGSPEQNPIPETAELRPTNPYGESKVACEELLTAHVAKHLDWSIVMLRYFNPVGSHDSALLGEFPKNAANIAAIIMEVLRGVRDEVKINGIDYETPDKTCIRDYIHIVDLATAHLAALEWTTKHLGEVIYNVGTGRGYSVKEILGAFAAAAGQEIKMSVGPRRIGDVEIVVADASKIQNELGWRAKHGLEEIAASAVAWVKKNPHGFDD